MADMNQRVHEHLLYACHYCERSYRTNTKYNRVVTIVPNCCTDAICMKWKYKEIGRRNEKGKWRDFPEFVYYNLEVMNIDIDDCVVMKMNRNRIHTLEKQKSCEFASALQRFSERHPHIDILFDYHQPFGIYMKTKSGREIFELATAYTTAVIFYTGDEPRKKRLRQITL